MKKVEERTGTVNALWPFIDDADRVVHPVAKAIGTRNQMIIDENESVPTPVRVRSSMIGIEEPEASRPTVTLGWHPDVPDFRDLTIYDDKPAERLAAQFTKLQGKKNKSLPRRHENLKWCSPVENQGKLRSCTAQAVVGLVEYMQRRSNLRHVDGSRLFVYHVTRRLLGWSGDSGGYLRTAMKAVAAFGVPPEEYWPYDESRFDEEPTPFLYSFAKEYQALDYARIDLPQVKPEDVLENLKRTIASGLAVAFGFSVYSSLTNGPDIPDPKKRDRLKGGHAVMAVGYDDDHCLPDGTKCPSLIIRNSWGANWGVGGYGFLPYSYIERGIAKDFWTVLKTEWLDLEKFD